MTAVRDEFEHRADPFRRELLAHCYRMTGSLHDAEDLVQETYLRAWKSYKGFQGKSSVRTWLYRIATNTCLTALDSRQRRPLPTGLGAPSSDPEQALVPAFDVPWVQPMPDAMLGAAPAIRRRQSASVAVCVWRSSRPCSTSRLASAPS